MEAFWKYIALAVAAALMALTLRADDRSFGMAFSLAAGVLLLLLLLEPLRRAMRALLDMAGAAQIGEEHTGLLLKMLGVSFASEFAAQACRDAGENGIALRIETAAKVMLAVLAAPVLEELTRLILELTA